MCRGFLLYKILRILPGIFLEEQKSGNKIAQKSGGPKIKNAKNPFCQKPTLQTVILVGLTLWRAGCPFMRHERCGGQCCQHCPQGRAPRTMTLGSSWALPGGRPMPAHHHNTRREPFGGETAWGHDWPPEPTFSHDELCLPLRLGSSYFAVPGKTPPPPPKNWLLRGSKTAML